MNARIALLVLLFASACNRPHSADAQLADLPHKVIRPFLGGFELTFAPDDDTCGELDLSKTRATLNGQPLAFSGNGGANLSIKGRWGGTCESIFLNPDSAPLAGPVVLQLQDGSQTLTAAWDTFGDARELAPEFDGGVSPGQVLRFALTPAADTVIAATDAGLDSTWAELSGPDGGDPRLEVGFGEHELQVTLPGDAELGSATLELHQVSSTNPATRCEGFEACSPDVHSLDAAFTLDVAP